MEKYLLIIRLAIEGVFRSKMRAFLTMLGIIIGVGSVISIISIGSGAQSLITNSLKDMGTDLIAVLPGKSDDKGPPASALGIIITTLTNEDAKAISKLPTISKVTAFISGNGTFTAGRRSISANFTGVTENYQEIENHFIESGRFFSKKEILASENVAILGSEIKKELFPGSDPIGEKVKINNVSFRIIGVFERKGSSLIGNSDSKIVIPLGAAQKKILGSKHVSFIRMRALNEEIVPKAKVQVEQLLTYRHEIKSEGDKDFSVRAITSAMDVFNKITSGLSFFLAAIAAVSLIVGGIGITNIMLMTVTERTREIGLRKAIGAKQSHIKNQFLLEALVLTSIGGIIGIIGGALFSFLVAVIVNYMGYKWDFSLSITAILVSFFVSVFIGITFGIYPAKKAAKLNPIDALRYE